MESSPCSPKPEKAWVQKWRPSTTKNKFKKYAGFGAEVKNMSGQDDRSEEDTKAGKAFRDSLRRAAGEEMQEDTFIAASVSVQVTKHSQEQTLGIVSYLLSDEILGTGAIRKRLQLPKIGNTYLL